MGIMDRTFLVRFLKKEDFDAIVKLGDKIVGKHYTSRKELEDILKRSTKDGVNCSFTLSINEGDGAGERLIGFRLTCAPGQWVDSYSRELSRQDWGFDPEKVAYLKSNMIEEEFRGRGFGRMLLDYTVAAAKRAGADAGVAQVWMNSPGNSAFKYFTRAGGRLIKIYPAYWADLHDTDALCSHCGAVCNCPAAEMIIDFSTYKEIEHNV
jgi:ribosomal protein S18 acetylase RimI-like enzyme